MENSEPAAKLALWRWQLFMTLAFPLLAWLGVVHALAALLVILLGHDAQTFEHLKAAMEADGRKAFDVIMLSLLGPSAVLWMPLEWLRHGGRKRTGQKPALWRRRGVIAAEIALIVWIAAMHLAAGCCVLLLGRDVRTFGELVAALTAVNNAKTIVASIALIAGPSFVLWLAASWGQAWLRARAARDTLLAATKEQG